MTAAQSSRTEVVMPALGMAQETGKLLRWLKAEGDQVAVQEPLMEVETDKVTVEIGSPAGGVLADVRAAEGDDVPVGDVIALILADGAEVPAPAAVSTAEPSEPPERPEPPEPMEPMEPMEPREPREPIGHRVGGAPASSGRVPSSPLARRRARERGVDLDAILGSGPGGAVLASDVSPAASARAEETSGTEAAQAGAVWQRMVERTTASWTSAPHFYLFRDVEAERLADWRASIEDSGDGRVTVTDLLVKLAADALVRHPEVVARWERGRVVRWSEVNVGIAVAVEDGLVVPVIHGADRLTVREIADRRGELVARARAGGLRLEDVRDGTFTLSNLGMYGVDVFAAVLNPPQAAILSCGRILERVVAVDGRPAVRRMMTLGLSCDHRALDGARAARFLDTLAASIEGPPGLGFA